MREINDRYRQRVIVETVRPKRLLPRDRQVGPSKKPPPDEPEYATEDLHPRPRQPGGYETR